MRNHQAANELAGHLHIRDLKRHPDHEREIDEIPVVGLIVIGKFQPTDVLVASFAVKLVRIMKREDDVDEGPRQHNCEHGVGNIKIPMAGIGTTRRTKLSKDRGQARDRSQNCEYQNEPAAFVLSSGSTTHQGDIEARDYDKGQREINYHRDIPAEKNAGG